MTAAVSRADLVAQGKALKAQVAELRTQVTEAGMTMAPLQSRRSQRDLTVTRYD